MKIVIAVSLMLTYAVVFADESGQLLGRPDGHEPYERNTSRPLIGRPDGHEPYERNTSRPLIGRPDGHERHNDDEKPLVRCKRPICEMYCDNGFKKDSNGCPTCQCDDDELIGRPDGHEPGTVNCFDRPMCRMYCELGFQRDKDGCEICQCLDNPCLTNDCEDGFVCQPVPCLDKRHCTQLGSKCVAKSPGRSKCRGPEPMCANYCVNGYKYNDDGCMTCKCVEPSPSKTVQSRSHQCNGPQPMCAMYCAEGYKYDDNGCMTCECLTSSTDVCMGKQCDEGLTCRNKTVDDSVVPYCSVKTACEVQQDTIADGQPKPDCETDGTFKPLQCDEVKSICWCVDGLGREIDDSRSQLLSSDDNKPDCVRNNTVSMHIHMMLITEHHIDITHDVDSLTTTIVDHVSSWLMVEPHYVQVVKTQPQSSELDAGPDDDRVEVKMVSVEIIVIHDGVSDLPSASDYMKQQMKKGRCNIPVNGGKLVPDPDSVSVEHKFAHNQPQHYDAMEPFRSTLRLTLCAVGAVLLVLFIITIASVVIKSRRRRAARCQFKHHKLESPFVSEKNLLGSDELAGPVVMVTEDKLKEPIA